MNLKAQLNPRPMRPAAEAATAVSRRTEVKVMSRFRVLQKHQTLPVQGFDHRAQCIRKGERLPAVAACCTAGFDLTCAYACGLVAGITCGCRPDVPHDGVGHGDPKLGHQLGVIRAMRGDR